MYRYDYALRIVHTHNRSDKKNPFIQDRILEFMAIVNRAPTMFVSDNAKEYISKDMRELPRSFNIQHQPLTPYH